jgi:hypothetical protein
LHHTACCLQITGHFEGLPGKRIPIKGESAEYSLEVVKYDKGSKGEQRHMRTVGPDTDQLTSFN